MLDLYQNLMESSIKFLLVYQNKRKLTKISGKQTLAEKYLNAPKICLILLQI